MDIIEKVSIKTDDYELKGYAEKFWQEEHEV